MAETTKIQWTNATFNPWIGCTKIAPGCAQCYAHADMDLRRHRVKWGPNGTRSRTSDKYWRQPIKWNREAERDGERRRVFCASLADVFEQWGGKIHDAKEQVLIQSYLGDARDTFDETIEPWESFGDKQAWKLLTMDDLRRDLFELIDRTPWLDWLLVTKRPENIRSMWPSNRNASGTVGYLDPRAEINPNNKIYWHRENVWLLTSISDQPTADAMIPALLACRDLAPVLGVSAEPLLGCVDLMHYLESDLERYSRDDRFGIPKDASRAKLDWVICGAESQHGRRPMKEEWAASLVEQCRASGTACFVKQMEIGGKVTGNMDDFPERLRVRQYPTVTP